MAKKPPRISAFEESIVEKASKLDDNLKKLEEATADKSRLKDVLIENIVSPKFHDRTAPSKASILELAKNIQAVGLQQPIVLRKLENGQLERIIGFRRIEAMKLLEKKEIPAIILEGISDADATLMMVSENLQRENLNVYDETVALLEFVAVSLNKSTDQIKSFLFKIKNFYGGKIQELSEEEKESHELINIILERTGKFNIQTFINRLRVLKLDQIIINAMRDNKITYSIAIELQKLKDSSKIQEIIDEIAERGMTTKEIVDRVELLNGGNERARLSHFKEIKNIFNDAVYKKLPDESKREVDQLISRLQELLK
ncbi:ParB/RepB/Spo0J family partition protein (plasmid) [Sulfurospirillum sp. 'SP']|jgi:ParB family chromosome partitioning protein|nr:ParB/RepB/Spo0J family partition protein [Sulfurospirillum sp. 'SP']WNZ00251.1 ParB/RepB/Spo0J family partition protein [Sulfurospirillum sp. 'SP']